MVPIPAEYLPDFWDQISTECMVEVTCLLPNGIIILLNVNYNATLADIKEDLWEEAAKYPLYGKLHNMSVYIFTYINSMAEKEKLVDESRRLCDIRPTGAVLIITECREEEVDDSLNISIGHLIGKRLQEFDALNNSEVNEFRFKMRKMGEEIAENRKKQTWLEKLFYQFPPRISTNSYILTEYIKENKYIKIASKFDNEYDNYDSENRSNEKEVMQSSFTFNVPPSIKPKKLLEMIIAKRATILNRRHDRSNEYVLKVCGLDDFLVGEYEIIEFQYIQDCISREIIPTLVTVHVDRVPVSQANDYESLDIFDNKKNKPVPYNSTNTLRKKKNTVSSWSVTDNYETTVNTISKLNVDSKKNPEIGLQIGLFHGGKPLCETQRIYDKATDEKCECGLDTAINFDIQVNNIPKAAKLCFVIYEVVRGKGTKSKKLKDASKDWIANPLAWVNMSVFDFKSQLKTGALTLYMWTYAEDMNSEMILNPLGTVVCNPNTEYATAISIDIKSYTKDQIIMFPSIEVMKNYAKDIEREQREGEVPDIQLYKKQLYNFDLYEIHDQDRKNMWSLRYYWRDHNPEFLPKLLLCIDWDKREDVSQAVYLLSEWPKLPIEKSLELLDFAYADHEVRSFAVKCLWDVSDEDLLLFLLQLVQAIKHEIFTDCDLVHFLLRRALTNQKIGHFLFWHLKSEMQVPSVCVRFGLILEAYLRGTQEHIHILQKQLDCLDTLKKCSDLIRIKKDKEKARGVLREYLSKSSAESGFNYSRIPSHHTRNPLDPTYRCRKIKYDKCKIMDSKMRPLWVVFENSDTYGDDIYIIFKNGDDLRQDMLTLQMIKVMDRLWKGENLDLRMNPYGCISLEHRVGMIEVVLNAETIANIQKEKGMFTATAAFRKGPILAWLKDYNTTEAALNKAVTEFTLSCAGYCVATYVLGIADRHSDNIMVKRNGQLFHIDFGHILGHFKEKFGFKRERVPFVLTHDFVYVINKGQNSKALEFKIFQEYCERAFMILRKHGNLILSLFAMMISTGLPELTSEKDLNYLRETLVLNKTDEEALQHFRTKFDEALSNSWKTSLNWASHNIAKNNKT